MNPQTEEGLNGDLTERIAGRYGQMSKRQKLLADYIRENYDKTIDLTAAKLGEMVGVSESTVVRFAMYLGYRGYPEFQRALEELARNSLNSIQRMRAAKGRMEGQGVLHNVLRSDEEKIRNTLTSIDQKNFNDSVKLILKARSIYIMGIRSCNHLAGFLSYYLDLMFHNVRQLSSNSTSELYEQMVQIGSQDVIIGISFPRYSNRTQQALAFAKTRGAKVIALTDSLHSPIVSYADCSLIAESDMVSIVDSLVAPLSVINALIAACCNEKEEEISSTLNELEQIWMDYKVYGEKKS